LRNSGAPGVSRGIQRSDFDAVEVAPTGERWFTNAAFFADLDGDGHLDLVIGNYFRDGAHTLDANAAGAESMHDTKSKSFNGGSKHLLLWKSAAAAPRPSVQFGESSDVLDERVTHGWSLAGGAADLDGDLLPEIYFAHDFGPDRLLHNSSTPGHPRFEILEGRRDLTTPASCVLGRDSFKGMGVDFGDLNGDGIPDIYVSNIADTYAAQESHFLWLSTGNTEDMKRGALRTRTAPSNSASREAGGGGTRGWPISTTTVCSRPCRRWVSLRGRRIAGRSCRHWGPATIN
jgi:enediyne biosynthesis protein E4